MRNLDLTSVIWRKATASETGGNCVEIADLHGARLIAVRDSKHPNGPKLAFDRAAWKSFAERVAKS